jgi:hypothetical protein
MAEIMLPDFEDLYALIEVIKVLSLRKAKLELEIKYDEGQVVAIATTDPAYLVGGKIPSMAFIDSTLKISGINGSLLPKRQELAEVAANLEEKKLILDMKKTQIEVWRTLSANERRANL